MKKISFAIAAIGMVLGVASCNKSMSNDSPVAPIITPDAETGVVNFGLKGDETKASTASEKESTVVDYQIFVFNEDGTLDIAGKQTGTSDLSLKCTLGDKKVYALVNHSSDITATIANEAALKAVTSALGDNAVGTKFVMFGSCDVSVPASSTVKVPVDRIVAKVVVKKITNKLNASLGKITLNGIYVINAPNDATVGDTTYVSAAAGWYNQRKYVASGVAAVEALLAENSIAADIANGSSYSTAHYFYAYPNPTSTDSSASTFSARYSRLVLDCTIENDVDGSGTAVAHRYYPINLVVEAEGTTPFAGLKRNKTYTLSEVKITRLGSLDPDTPISSSEAAYNIKVNDWGVGFDKSVEF